MQVQQEAQPTQQRAPQPPHATWPQHGAGLRRLWAARPLIGIWLKYNIQSRYRHKLLGVLWIVLIPIAQALIFTLVFSQLLSGQVGAVPFVSFYLTGLIGWSLFSNGLHKGMAAIESQREVVTQIYFPREILIIIQLAEVLIDSAFMFLVLLIVNALHGIVPSAALLAFPLLLAIQLVLTLGLMLFLAPLSILVRDTQPLVGVATMLLFYLTPVIYPATALPESLRQALALNPMTPLIEAYRGMFLHATLPDLSALVYPAALAGVVLIFGYRFFKKYEPVVVDIM